MKLKVVSLMDAKFSPSSPLQRLTEKQRDVLIKAYKLGYYDRPRKISSEVSSAQTQSGEIDVGCPQTESRKTTAYRSTERILVQGSRKEGAKRKQSNHENGGVDRIFPLRFKRQNHYMLEKYLSTEKNETEGSQLRCRKCDVFQLAT